MSVGSSEGARQLSQDKGHYILGKPLYLEGEFKDAEEEAKVYGAALADGIKMESQGFYILSFSYSGGRLRVRLGEKPSSLV